LEKSINKHLIATPIGNLLITVENEKLIGISFADPKTIVATDVVAGFNPRYTIRGLKSAATSLRIKNKELATSPTPFAKAVLTEIANYFKKANHKFTIKAFATGTELQKKIWHACQKIASGQTKTYSDIAKEIGTSPRVVGNAMRSNPIMLVIPCHRVVAKNGLGGFCGKGSGKMLKAKKYLLDWEKN
jgi:methylated-DNA-[protein]-cysteine S-methyltransferase